MMFQKSKSKYRNKKTTRVVNGEIVKMDSLKEARRLDELILLLRAKKISDLVLQPKFLLQDKFTDKNGVKHRAIHYVADFKYAKDGVEIIEDVKASKSFTTDVFKIKKKLLLFKYPEINFIET